MSNIHIERSHHLGIENARAQVEELAQSLRDELHADYQWNGDSLVFKRAGASGTIDVSADSIRVDIELDLMLSLMKGIIEDRIKRRLDAAVG